jgi:putative chromate ion transporter
MDAENAPPAAVERSSLRAFLLYFLRLGTLGFGGPIALAGHMQQDLVEQRGWISAQDYEGGPSLGAARPRASRAAAGDVPRLGAGPGARATLVALAFVGPSFPMVLILSELYVRFGGLPWMQGSFYGIAAAVIAIIARSVLKLVRMTLGRDQLLWVLFTASALVTAWTESEIVWVFLLCGLVPMLVRGRQTAPTTLALAFLPTAPGLATGLGGPASVGVLWKILAYFAGAGLFVFGSGLAIVPFLYGGVVQQFHWLTERQFIDAVAVSMITPGPVVIYGGVHRLPRRGTRGRDPRRDRGLSAGVSGGRLRCSTLPSGGEKPAGTGVRRWRHSGSHGGDRRCCRDPRSAVAPGPADDPDRARDRGAPAGFQEDPGAPAHRRGGARRVRAKGRRSGHWVTGARTVQWLTRRQSSVNRTTTAWLIRRFIDPNPLPCV